MGFKLFSSWSLRYVFVYSPKKRERRVERRIEGRKEGKKGRSIDGLLRMRRI